MSDLNLVIMILVAIVTAAVLPFVIAYAGTARPKELADKFCECFQCRLLNPGCDKC